MATRLNTRQADSVRANIQAQRIVEELQASYFGTKPEKSAGQIRTAEILLNKTLPNLAATQVELSGDALTVQIVSYADVTAPKP